MSSFAANQARTFGVLLQAIRPHIRSDRNLPGRIHQAITREKRFGSRDRRLYRELLYTAVRHWPWFEELETAASTDAALEAMVWLAAPLPSVQPLKELLGTRFPGLPETVAARAEVLQVKSPLVPSWVAEECPAAALPPEIDFLHRRSPLWLRLSQESRAEVLSEFDRLGWKWRETGLLPTAVELLGDVDVTRTDAFARGRLEVQDLGSQLILEAVGVERGSRWLDACAGAGGKTLQLAQLTGAGGRVVAHDIRIEALDELSLRARRSRQSNIDISLAPSGAFDGVLVDAPCSGSGTWRRSPHLKWCTTPGTIAAAAEVQLGLLERFAGFVRSSGKLVYATCSLCGSEDAGVVRRFLAAHPEFAEIELSRAFTGRAASPGTTFWPSGHDGDGFHVAALQRQ